MLDPSPSEYVSKLLFPRGSTFLRLRGGPISGLSSEEEMLCLLGFSVIEKMVRLYKCATVATLVKV